MFEEKILGNLTEERFKKLSEKYEDEQAELTQHIRHMKKVVAEEQKHELNAEGFLRLVRKCTDIEMLTRLWCITGRSKGKKLCSR